MSSAREKRIGLEAAQWVVKFDGVEFEPRDVRAFRAWLAKSDDHRAAFQRASRAWTDLDILARVDAFQLPASAEPSRLSRRAVLAGGAGVVLAVTTASYVALSSAPAEAFETGVGERRDVTLPDGTRVAMNADTRIEARIDPERREVRVIRGEALFHIAESNAGPFRIVSENTKLEAAAGVVLIKVFAYGARVSLLSGAARASRPALFGASAPLTVGANNQVLFNAEAIFVEPVGADRLARSALWRVGMLAFDGTILAEAAADVTRQTGVRFVFEDRALSSMRIIGLIRADDLAGFLDLLRTNLGIEAERRGDEVRLRLSA